ncbi:MAG: hypothetical protein RL385_2051 [Pseudomonadota bacterium]|jgi:putative ABC transport system permease protein
MLELIRLIALRNLGAARARTFLTLLGIVLGVAVVFATHVLNRSVMASFRSAVEEVSGRTQLSVGRGTGVEEAELERIRAVKGVKAAAPVIEDTLRDEDHAVVLALLGVDAMADRDVRDYDALADDVQVEDELAFLNDPHGILVPRSYAARHGVKVGDSLTLSSPQGTARYNVRGLLSPKGPAQIFGGDMVVMDVLAAQIALQRGQRFDRVDVLLDSGQDPAKIAAEIERSIAYRAKATRPDQRTEETERLLSSFKLALSLTSLVALFVGAFIVYNALAIAVAQRRRDIGVLRALGMTRTTVRNLFVGEGVLMGLWGSLIGLGVGLGLARVALSLVGQTVSALYVKVEPRSLAIAPADVLGAMVLGLVASALAAWFPAQRASRVEPVQAMERRPAAGDVSLGAGRSAAVACAGIFALAGGLALLAHRSELPWMGHAVSALMALGAAFAAPFVARLVAHAGTALCRRIGPSAQVGALSFERDAGRSAVAIAALGMALANVIAVDTLLSSMKSSTHQWLGRAFRADLFVLAGTDVRAKFEQPMPAALRAEFAADPDVRFVQAFRMLQQTFRDKPFYVMSEDLQGYVTHNQLSVAEGDFGRSVAAMQRGESVGVSQTFARTFQLGLGDTLPLQTAQGPRTFRIDLVYVDYRTDSGAVLMDRAVFTHAYADPLVDLYGIYLRPGSDGSAARARIAHGAAQTLNLLVLEHRAYMEQLVGLIDRSLALSRAAEAVAILVALLGMVNTLTVSVLDRRAELGTLRAVGASRAQVQRIVLTEALLMAFSAALVGVATGVLLASYNVQESLRFQLGWQLELRLELGTLVTAFVVCQVAGLLSALLPMRSAAQLDAKAAVAGA